MYFYRDVGTPGGAFQHFLILVDMTLIGPKVTRIGSVNSKVLRGQKAFPIPDKEFEIYICNFSGCESRGCGPEPTVCPLQGGRTPSYQSYSGEHIFIYLSFLRSRPCQFTTDLEDFDKLE